MSRRTALALAAAAAALLAPPGGAGAAELELRIASRSSGQVVGARAVSLRAGEEVRFVRPGVRLPGRPAPLDLVFGVRLREESERGVTVDLHAIVRRPGEPTPLAYTARTYALGQGEAASFAVEPERTGGLEFSARLGAVERPGGGELEPVRFSTTLALRERGPDGERVLEQRLVRLAGPAPTEIVLEAPAGGGDGALVLRLVPRARDDDGVRLDLTVESLPSGRRGERVIRDERLELGWDDVVSIAGLVGPGGPLLVELKPER